MPGRLRSPPQLARELFAPIAPSYQRYARLLSMGQDPRWRRSMVGGLELPPGGKILDVASGTGSITRLLQSQGLEVVSVDQSEEMLAVAVAHGATGVLSTAERLPFPDGAFDGVTFGYLLRYVESVEGCLEELARVVRSGGVVGMVEFGRPAGVLRPVWWAYTRIVLPLTGAVIRSGWWEVGRFLGPSIDRFAQAYPPDVLARDWRAAGFQDIRIRRMSFGGGLIMWARKT